VIRDMLATTALGRIRRYKQSLAQLLIGST
jgi:hypothetical protein